jgi:hypothetical protein
MERIRKIKEFVLQSNSHKVDLSECVSEGDYEVYIMEGDLYRYWSASANEILELDNPNNAEVDDELDFIINCIERN